MNENVIEIKGGGVFNIILIVLFQILNIVKLNILFLFLFLSGNIDNQ